MKLKKTIFLVLVTLMTAGLAQAQEGLAAFSYTMDIYPSNTPLGCPCTNPVPYGDGLVSYGVYWDRNGNGVDAADSLIPVGVGYGQGSWQCASFNGVMQGFGAGFFYTEEPLVIQDLPVAPDSAMYYLQISTSGSSNCCWTTISVPIETGYHEIPFQRSDWTCQPNSCPNVSGLPAAASNVTASDNTGCLLVTVTWQHSGQNIAGFNIYEDGVYRIPASSDARSLSIPTQCGPHTYMVKATNCAGESPASNTDQGSTYLLKFSYDPPCDTIDGFGRAGQPFTVCFDSPTENCYSYATLWLLVNNQRHDSLCFDSLTDEMTCTFPANNSLYNCRLLLDARSFDTGEHCYDTTGIFFHLGLTADDAQALLPDRFGMAQNYPNPFNPETSIQFMVPYTADVKILVYNISGQLVRTLVNGNYSTGIHSVTWDGRSDAGSPVSAGLYLYRMTGSNFSQTHKMLLLK
jgi:hypothetical protein